MQNVGLPLEQCFLETDGNGVAFLRLMHGIQSIKRHVKDHGLENLPLRTRLISTMISITFFAEIFDLTKFPTMNHR